jgi:hypothetical protein
VLAKQVLYCLNHTSSPFCSGYFGNGGLVNYLPRLVSNGNLTQPPSRLQVEAIGAQLLAVTYLNLKVFEII